MLRDVSLYSRENEMSEDYAFRYKLDLNSRGEEVYHQRLTDFMRILLESLLNVVMPLEAGKDAKIDGFRWMMDREKAYQLFLGKSSDYQDGSNTAFYEPRIDFIKKLIESLRSLVEFEQEGQVVKIDGFRLKNLEDWTVPSAGDPGEVFEHAGSRCNCDCVFCCNKGNPPYLAASNNLKRPVRQEFEEIKTRIKYFSPEAGSALFPSIGSVCEVMAHPKFMDILYLLRQKTSNPFKITTNGKNLTPKVIAELSELKPIYLFLSLNSSSTSRRRRLMKDHAPEVAINSLGLLREQSIPYAVVIVPWPMDSVEEMLEDLSSTVAYAAEHEAHLVQINLPGYSRYFSSTKLFDLNEMWKAIVFQVRELRERYDLPIVAMPTMYEENICQPRKNLPQITGLVKNSPAYFSGLKRGDIILQINGIRIRNRPQAIDLLYTLRRNEVKEATFVVQRGSQILELSLDLTKHSYPYPEQIDTHSGIIFMGTGLRIGYIEKLREIIQAHQAKRVLFLSSALVKPTFEQCLAGSHLFGDGQAKVEVKIPENRFFGGNIFMGDLLVVEDLIACVEEYIMEKGYKPDLVVVPSSPFNLSGWGRDLAGRVYLDIERETGVPVELLECSTIYN